MVDSALPLPELWRLRTPSSLVRGVALLKDGGDTGLEQGRFFRKTCFFLLFICFQVFGSSTRQGSAVATVALGYPTRCPTRPSATGVTTLAELRAPGVPAIDGLAEILFPTGLPRVPRGFSTVMTDSFTHRTYVGGVRDVGSITTPNYYRKSVGFFSE